MLMYPNKWHRGSGYGSLEEGFNVAQCQATVTAALNHACCIKCSLLCVAHYVTKHKCVFPLMRTEVELLGHPRRTWLGQQTIRSGASSKDWTEVAAALKTSSKKNKVSGNVLDIKQFVKNLWFLRTAFWTGGRVVLQCQHFHSDLAPHCYTKLYHKVSPVNQPYLASVGK